VLSALIEQSDLDAVVLPDEGIDFWRAMVIVLDFGLDFKLVALAQECDFRREVGWPLLSWDVWVEDKFP
jgi:hypothetical protein